MACCCDKGDSILLTIRKMIGPSVEYDVFDTDLIIHINSAFSRLCQLGVGPESPFRITGIEETWDDFIPGNMSDDIIQYVYLKTKMMFDTPASGTVVDAIQKQIDMLEWTLKEVAQFGY